MILLLLVQEVDLDAWVRDLASDSSEVRECAMECLSKLDASRVPELRAALDKSRDLEQIARLKLVIDRVERGPVRKFSKDDPVHRSDNAKDAVVEVLDEGRRLRWRREGGDGGRVNVRLALGKAARQVRISGQVKIVRQDLEGPGWWSDTNGGCYEYPVHLTLVSKKGEHVWCGGYLKPFTDETKAKNYTIVDGAEWADFDTGWIKPDVAVESLDVGGDGWGFEAEVRDLRIGLRE